MKRTCKSPAELLDRPARGPDFTLLIEARDFLRVHLPQLPEKQRSVVIAWAGGKTCREIAGDENVGEEAIRRRLGRALIGLRRLGGD